MKFLQKFIVCLLFGLSLIFSPAKAFSVSPIRYKVSIDPGKSQYFTLNVANDDQVATTYTVQTSGFIFDDQGKLVYKNGEPAEKWFALPKDFVLNPGEAKSLDITISVPVAAEPGSRQVAVLVGPVSKTGQVSLSPKTAFPVYITVAGRITESLSVEKWLSGKQIYYGKPWPFEVEIRNNGNVSVGAAGMVEVADFTGKKVVGQAINFGNAVFPESVRKMQSVFTPAGFLMPGPYRATVQVQYGALKNIASSAIVFWYLPIWFMVAASIVLLIIIYAGVALYKKAKV